VYTLQRVLLYCEWADAMPRDTIIREAREVVMVGGSKARRCDTIRCDGRIREYWCLPACLAHVMSRLPAAATLPRTCTVLLRLRCLTYSRRQKRPSCLVGTTHKLLLPTRPCFYYQTITRLYSHPSSTPPYPNQPFVASSSTPPSSFIKSLDHRHYTELPPCSFSLSLIGYTTSYSYTVLGSTTSRSDLIGNTTA